MATGFGLAVMAVAQMKRIILEPESAILDLGRDARSFTKNMKLAMLVAARGRCSSFGCDAPFSWLQADHIIEDCGLGFEDDPFHLRERS